jgi:hypothetical protein
MQSLRKPVELNPPEVAIRTPRIHTHTHTHTKRLRGHLSSAPLSNNNHTLISPNSRVPTKYKHTHTHTHTQTNHINHHTKRKTSSNIKTIIATTCYFQSAEYKKFNWLHKSHLRTTDHNSSVPEPRQRLTMLKIYPKAFSRHPKLINHIPPPQLVTTQ